MDGTAVTDASIELLAEHCPQLRLLFVADTAVTEACRKRALRQELRSRGNVLPGKGAEVGHPQDTCTHIADVRLAHKRLQPAEDKRLPHTESTSPVSGFEFSVRAR